MYADRNLTCVDCNASFVFTAGEQEFHAAKGFTNEPRRCPACRSARKNSRGEGGGGGRGPGGGGGGFGAGGGARERYEVNCDECGTLTTVPFKPTGTKPVYCRDCYASRGGGTFSGGGGGNRGGGGGGRGRY